MKEFKLKKGTFRRGTANMQMRTIFSSVDKYEKFACFNGIKAGIDDFELVDAVIRVQMFCVALSYPHAPACVVLEALPDADAEIAEFSTVPARSKKS